MNRHFWVAAIFAMAAHCGAAQTPPQNTLAESGGSMHWDSAKRGPLTALEPEGVKATIALEGLSAFGRMRVSLNGLTAIVPDTMVVIDDSMLRSPISRCLRRCSG
jgi:hypothetical protein